MMRFRRAASVLIVLVVAGLAGLGGSQTQAATPATAPLTIGAVLSLTGGGNVYGPQQAKAAQLAVAQLNAAGGIGGVPVRLVILDDKSDPATGKAAMRQLIQKDNAIAILGPTLSLVAVAADPIADSLKTPVVAISNTANGIVGKCAYPCTWIWRDSLGESIAVPANIEEYTVEAHPSTAAILYSSGDVLGSDEAGIAAASFAQNDVKVVTKAAVPPTGSVAAAVREALAKKPGVVFIGASFGQIAANVMSAARSQGYTGTFLGGNTFNSNVTAGLAKKAGTGARSASAWYSGNDFPANTSFETAYKQRYGEAADQFAAQSFIGVQILADALARGAAQSSKPIATRRAMVQAALSQVALTTPLGPFRFTADHDVSQIVWILAITASGHHRLVGFCNPEC
jgi:branched-chain amino acid transport system substrate-binding protein